MTNEAALLSKLAEIDATRDEKIADAMAEYNKAIAPFEEFELDEWNDATTAAMEAFVAVRDAATSEWAGESLKVMRQIKDAHQIRKINGEYVRVTK